MKQTALIVICVLLITSYSTTLAEKTSPTNRAVITQSQPIQTQPLEQVALVIGNNDYDIAPLKNAVNDATKIAAVLKQKGFKVILKTDLTYADMNEELGKFEDELVTKRDVGLFFYAGHGVQIKGENFLIPINNQEMRRESDVENKSIKIDDVMGRMEKSGVKFRVIIVDACRDNPFKFVATRSRSMSMTRGLAEMRAAEGTILAFATDPNSVASDGDEGQGLYTKHLVEALKTPHLPIQELFQQVREKVDAESHGKQRPWANFSLGGRYCFGGCIDPKEEIKRLEELLKAAADKAAADKAAADKVAADKVAADKAAAEKAAANKDRPTSPLEPLQQPVAETVTTFVPITEIEVKTVPPQPVSVEEEQPPVSRSMKVRGGNF